MPVVGGAAVIGLIFLATWGIAAFISRGGAESTAASLRRVQLGGVEARADSIAEDGPLMFPG